MSQWLKCYSTFFKPKTKEFGSIDNWLSPSVWRLHNLVGMAEVFVEYLIPYYSGGNA
jgi:hypothetical protein